MRNVKVFQDLSKLSRHAAEQFIKIGQRAIKSSGRFTVALAGGSTPKTLYQLLADEEFRDQIDWENVFFFFGDVRDVSPMSDRSNFRMANELLLNKLEIPRENIIRWRTEIIDAAGVAESYEKTLARFFELENGKFPKFDLVLLGLGEDGHTASLFPQSSALSEQKRIAVSSYVEKLDANRLTLTPPTINSAANIIFLVAGKEKAPALFEVLNGERNPDRFPAQLVEIRPGKVRFFVDSEAASELE